MFTGMKFFQANSFLNFELYIVLRKVCCIKKFFYIQIYP